MVWHGLTRYNMVLTDLKKINTKSAGCLSRLDVRVGWMSESAGCPVGWMSSRLDVQLAGCPVGWMSESAGCPSAGCLSAGCPSRLDVQSAGCPVGWISIRLDIQSAGCPSAGCLSAGCESAGCPQGVLSLGDIYTTLMLPFLPFLPLPISQVILLSRPPCNIQCLSGPG